MKKFLCIILALSFAIITILQFDIDVIKANQQAYEDALPSVIGNPSNYTNEAIQITIQDDAYLYSFSNDMIDYEWQHSNVSRYYGDNQEVYVTMMDENGNISPTRKVEITKIDRNKPNVSVSVDDSTLADGKVVIKGNYKFVRGSKKVLVTGYGGYRKKQTVYYHHLIINITSKKISYH